MPSNPRYRLLVPLPARVEFPSVSFQLGPETIRNGHGGVLECRLMARRDTPQGDAYLCATARDEAELFSMLSGPGIELRPSTVPNLVFARLADDGRAARIDPGAPTRPSPVPARSRDTAPSR